MSDHDPWCPRWLPEPFHLCQCDLITKVRAEEQAKVYEFATRMVLSRGEYLREKAEALPTVGGVTMPYVKGAEHQYEMVYRSDVLALFDGSSDE